MTRDTGCTRCGKCCGIVVCNAADYHRVVQFAQANNIIPHRQIPVCPWWHPDGCAVYSVRPFACRAMGLSRKLPCRQGHNRFLSPAKERQMEEAELARVKANPGVCMLHQACYTAAEINLALAAAGVNLKIATEKDVR